MRELGRRSEAAAMPFRAMPRDEAGGLRPSVVPEISDLYQDDLAHSVYAESGQCAWEAAAPRVGTGLAAVDAARQERGRNPPRPRHPSQPAYPPEGAFWHTSRTLGGVVRRAVNGPAAVPAIAPAPDAPPLVLARREGSRVLIAHACVAARAAGLRPGMAITMARAMVPGLDVRDADPDGVAADLERLARFAQRRWTPVAAPAGDDGLWLDMSGSRASHGGEEQYCRRLLRFLARLGLSARIAIAGTPGARMPSPGTGRAGQVLPPASRGAGAGAAPDRWPAARPGCRRRAAAARGGDDRRADRDAARAPRAAVRKSQRVRIDQALGRVAEPIDPVVPHETPMARLRFVEPIATAEAIATVIGDLLGLLVADLARRGQGARGLVLRCERVDGDRQTVTIGTATATRDARHLARLLLPKVETIDPGFGIEAMALAAPRCDPLGAVAMPGMLAGERPAPDIATLVDLVAGRAGTRRLYRTAALESDVPERSVRAVAAIGPPPPAHPGWARPLRLLDPAEPVQVLAELPDQPPRRFIWRGRTHLIVQGDGPERIHGEWWRRDRAEAVRDYYQVEDESGARFWLYRRGDGVDSRTGDLSWYIHGVFG
jgi:protein ImuB